MYEKYCYLRDTKGVRDAQVAKATGITRSTFTDWKNGRSEPKKEKLQRIADYFGVSVDFFLGVGISQQDSGYYINNETAKMAQEIFEDSDLRTLFDAARDCKPEDLKMAADLLKRLKGTNNEI